MHLLFRQIVPGFIIIVLVSMIHAARYEGDTKGGFYRIPNNEDKAWFQSHAVTVGHVDLNALGLKRVNESIQQKGLATIHMAPVPFGEEVGEVATRDVVVTQAQLPDRVENSELPYFPPISNQGGLGCCAAFSTTYYQFSHMKNMIDDDPIQGDRNRFSPKWTFNQVNGGGNNGTNFTDTYKVILKNGCASWQDMPYDDDCTSWSTNPEVWKKAMYNRIDKIGTLGLLRTDTEFLNLKKFLTNGYIIAFSTSIGNWQYVDIKNDPSTNKDDAYVGKKVVAWTKGGCDHAMVITGYNDNIWIDIDNDNVVDAGEKGALRIANSWGPGFNDNGFTFVAYDALTSKSKVPGYANAEKGDLIIETAWITAKKDYQPKLIGQCTLNSARRNQMKVELGYSSSTQTTPVKLWQSEAVFGKGGPLAFNGSTSALDGSFAFDFTDLILENNLSTGTELRWYLRVTDSIGDANRCTIKDFRVTNPASGNSAVCQGQLPQNADGSSVSCYVGFTLTREYRLLSRVTAGGILSQAGAVYYAAQDDATVSVVCDKGFFVKDVLVDSISAGALSTIALDNITDDHEVAFVVEHHAMKNLVPAAGVEYRCYEGAWDRLPDFGSLTPVDQGKTDSLTLEVRTQDDNFAVVFIGYVKAPVEGAYTFSLGSDDGSRLLIDSTVIVDNDGLHGSNPAALGTVWLEAGYHAFTLEYFDRTVTEELFFNMAGPGFSMRPVGFADVARYGGITTIQAGEVYASACPSVYVSTHGLRFRNIPTKNTQITFYDLSGRCIVQGILHEVGEEAEFLLPGLIGKGVYLCTVKTEHTKSFSQKVIIR